MGFSERLAELFQENHSNPNRLSIAINTSDTVVRGWKNGSKRPTLDNLVAVADYFGVSLDYLTGRSEVREVATSAPADTKKDPSPELSRNESDMLTLFRGLTDREQLLLMGQINGMILARSLQGDDAAGPPASQAG